MLNDENKNTKEVILEEDGNQSILAQNVQEEEVINQVDCETLTQDTFEQDLLTQQSFEQGVNPKRCKIDKLLTKPDIKYRGILSYRGMRILGFILMLCAQIYIAYSFAGKIVDMPGSALSFLNVLGIISLFALPMFLAANFCVIMSSREKIKKYLIMYSITALVIYLVVILIYYRYLYGAAYALIADEADAIHFADLVSEKLFGGLANYNVFIDLSLFSMFFFFLFYNPKKELSNKKLKAFRWCSVIPVVIALLAFTLYAMYYFDYINLPTAVLALLPCRSLTVYIIVFAISLVIKWRKFKFYSYGGTKEEYAKYLNTNRNSLEVSVLVSIIVVAICLIDFLLVLIDANLLLFGLGSSWYMAAIIPFVFLLSYSRKPKFKVIDYVLPALFVISCIIVYLEAIMYVLTSA